MALGCRLVGRGFRATDWLVVLLGALVAGCGVRTPGVALFPELAEFVGDEIRAVGFENPEPFPPDTLEVQIETEATHRRLLGLPIHIPFTRIGVHRRFLSLDRLGRDVDRLARFYRRAGYFGTRVRPRVDPVDADEVRVIFVIERGTPVILDELVLSGLDAILDPDSLRRTLPVQRGELFNLERFSAAADTVLRILRREGHAYADVLRSFDVDLPAGRATAEIEAIPGPRVRVDSILVLGADRLGRTAIVRQLAFQQGDLLRARELVDSQRNLYDLTMVQFASVALAEPELQVDPTDLSRATVAVRISENDRHRVEAVAGFGTVECIRSEAEWVDRNFAGRARRLAIRAGASRIGAEAPFSLGRLCPAFRDADEFRRRLDYRLAADLTQPWFLSPRNRLSGTVFSERQTEPRVFQREAFGARLAVSRRLATRHALTAALDIQRGRTVAVSGLFCATFDICLPEDVRELAALRWRNTLGLDWVLDRSVPPLDPEDGHLVRSGVAWAPSFLGADVRFVRWTGEVAAYRLARRDWVAAGFLRLGSVFGPASLDPGDDFLPPEERFFTGGAYSVRGFGRNMLGPGVYVGPDPVFDPDAVRFVPTGGTSVVVASAELRMPAPVARDLLGLAFFMDAGAVGTGHLWELGADAVRVTPGAGLRIATPVGPARLDVAYNPYPPEEGPLFLPVQDDPAVLIRALPAFAPERPTFWRRFRVHVALGQAF